MRDLLQYELFCTVMIGSHHKSDVANNFTRYFILSPRVLLPDCHF